MLEYDDKTKDKKEHVKLINNIASNPETLTELRGHIFEQLRDATCVNWTLEINIHWNENQDQNHIISEQI